MVIVISMLNATPVSFKYNKKTDPRDLDNWKRQVEERMPLLKGRSILEVEVVKRQSTFRRPDTYSHILFFRALLYINGFRLNYSTEVRTMTCYRALKSVHKLPMSQRP